MQERADAAVHIAAKVQPGCLEIGGEAEQLDAGGTGGFFRPPELERGVSGRGEVAAFVAEGGEASSPRSKFPGNLSQKGKAVYLLRNSSLCTTAWTSERKPWLALAVLVARAAMAGWSRPVTGVPVA